MIDRTRAAAFVDWVNAIRRAYELDGTHDQNWLKQEADRRPQEFLAAAEAIGVAMPWGSKLWLRHHTGGPPDDISRGYEAWLAERAVQEKLAETARVARERRAQTRVPAQAPPALAVVVPPSPPSPPSEVVPRANCLDCGDLLPRYRHLPYCTRCNRNRIQARQAAADAAAHERAQQAPVERVFNCLACRIRLDAPPVSGPLLCATCHEERYVEQPDEDNWLHSARENDWPQCDVGWNRRGELVIAGRVSHHRPRDMSPADVFGAGYAEVD
jgi:hypothetical protein